jgi:excisionase family DNA binding protein
MEDTPQIKPEWISYRDAQMITGLSRVTLWKMTRDGLIPASKQGRAVRLHRKSIDALMWRGTEDTRCTDGAGTPIPITNRPLTIPSRR